MKTKTDPEIEQPLGPAPEIEGSELDEEAGDDEDEGDDPEEQLQEHLLAALEEFYSDSTNYDGPRPRVQTFEQDGVLTQDCGLVIKIGKAEWQLSIVRSR